MVNIVAVGVETTRDLALVSAGIGGTISRGHDVYTVGKDSQGRWTMAYNGSTSLAAMYVNSGWTVTSVGRREIRSDAMEEPCAHCGITYGRHRGDGARCTNDRGTYFASVATDLEADSLIDGREELAILKGKLLDLQRDYKNLNDHMNDYADENSMCPEYEERIFSWNDGANDRPALTNKLYGRVREHSVYVNIPALADTELFVNVQARSGQEASDIVKQWNARELMRVITEQGRFNFTALQFTVVNEDGSQ